MEENCSIKLFKLYCLFLCSLQFLITGTGFSEYLRPVSYTHLDVYKRQAEFGFNVLRLFVFQFVGDTVNRKVLRIDSVFLAPMSLALEKTGASEYISNSLVSGLGSYGPIVLMAGIYFTLSLIHICASVGL